MSKKVLVLGGTRFFGKYLVQSLVDQGCDVTIATRGKTTDSFGDQVNRLIFDRTDEQSIKTTLTQETYDVIYDNIAYTSTTLRFLCVMSHPNATSLLAQCLPIMNYTSI